MLSEDIYQRGATEVIEDSDEADSIEQSLSTNYDMQPEFNMRDTEVTQELYFSDRFKGKVDLSATSEPRYSEKISEALI